MDFRAVLRNRPVIPAFRDIPSFRIQSLANTRVLFILGGTIFDLPDVVEQARRHKKLVFVDIDLIKGVGKDAPGIRFLVKESRVDGIITTHSNLIKSAQQEGMASIQRIFVLDSESLKGGLRAIEKSNPDALEVLPGLILPKITEKIGMITSLPVIAGGLITHEEEIDEILASGAVGVSTTFSRLFDYSAKR